MERVKSFNKGSLIAYKNEVIFDTVAFKVNETDNTEFQ